MLWYNKRWKYNKGKYVKLMEAIETFEDGLAAEERGDWGVALSVYKNLAQQGDERSIEKLVIYYGATEPNKSELKKWLQVGIKHVSNQWIYFPE